MRSQFYDNQTPWSKPQNRLFYLPIPWSKQKLCQKRECVSGSRRLRRYQTKRGAK